MKLRNLILLGVASFAVTAIWKMPASFAYQFLPQDKVKLQGLSGTVWDGKVKQATINNMSLSNIAWTVNVIETLSRFSLISDVSITDADVTANGLLGISPSQTITLDNTQVETTGAFITKLQKMVKLSGDISSHIRHLSVSKGELPVLDANILLKQGALIAPMRIAAVGDYSIVVEPTDNGLNAKISSNEAPLQLSGDATIDHKWNYNTNINIKPTKTAGKGLVNVLKLAGKPAKDGSIPIKQKGQLKPFY